MNPYTCGLALILLVCAATPGQAQQKTESAAIQVDPQAVAVIQNSYAAMGGPNLTVLADTRAVINIAPAKADDGPTFTSTITTSGTSMLRCDTKNTDGTTATTIINDTAAVLRTADGTAEQYPRAVFGSFVLTHLPVLYLSSVVANSAAKIEYLGLVPDGASQLYRIRVTLPSTPGLPLGPLDLPTEILIDSKSLLVAQIIYMQRAPADLAITQTLSVRYQQYSAMSGIMVPSQATYYAGNTVLSTQTITNFTANVGSTTSDFATD